MRICSVHIHRLRAPLKERFGWSLNWTSHREATLVEVRTDSGLAGWGDGFWGGERLLRNPSLVIGRSPFEAEAIYDALRPEPVAQSRRGVPLSGGLDTALWDLQGKALGLPVSQLFGEPVRTEVEPYCTALYRKDWPDFAEGLAEEAAGWERQGFRSMKMKIGFGVETDVRLVAAVRDALRPDTGLAVDANCAYDAGTAVALARRLEPFQLVWWEEPVLASNLAGYRRLRQATSIPLAGGETLDADTLLTDYVAPRLVDILQPEVERIGLTGARRISRACWLHDIRMIPHNWGTAVRTAAILHWMACWPTLTEALLDPGPLFEFDQTESPFRDAVIAERLSPNPAGRLPVPKGPGLGVTVLPDQVARFRTELIEVGQ